ncbi:uncharacterized protein LOC133473936, partial [Phyllopteryx taeniolatus]|uniref:uncharacterized protein LOC133473936 n=1 Tax=Phyllopteryx taeniolatus TaxID=161469 RepID=UPI002AD3969B
ATHRCLLLQKRPPSTPVHLPRDVIYPIPRAALILEEVLRGVSTRDVVTVDHPPQPRRNLPIDGRPMKAEVTDEAEGRYECLNTSRPARLLTTSSMLERRSILSTARIAKEEEKMKMALAVSVPAGGPRSGGGVRSRVHVQSITKVRRASDADSEPRLRARCPTPASRVSNTRETSHRALLFTLLRFVQPRRPPGGVLAVRVFFANEEDANKMETDSSTQRSSNRSCVLPSRSGLALLQKRTNSDCSGQSKLLKGLSAPPYPPLRTCTLPELRQGRAKSSRTLRTPVTSSSSSFPQIRLPSKPYATLPVYTLGPSAPAKDEAGASSASSESFGSARNRRSVSKFSKSGTGDDDGGDDASPPTRGDLDLPEELTEDWASMEVCVDCKKFITEIISSSKRSLCVASKRARLHRRTRSFYRSSSASGDFRRSPRIAIHEA